MGQNFNGGENGSYSISIENIYNSFARCVVKGVTLHFVSKIPDGENGSPKISSNLGWSKMGHPYT